MKYLIKQYRTEKKMTQEQLAERAGVSRPVISKLETDDNAVVNLSTLSKLANALDKNISDLYCA